MKNSKKRNERRAGAQAVVDYCLNRFCPPLIIATLLWSHFSLSDWRPYFIMGLVFFAEKYHFHVGYSVAFCEERGLDPHNEG